MVLYHKRHCVSCNVNWLLIWTSHFLCGCVPFAKYSRRTQEPPSAYSHVSILARSPDLLHISGLINVKRGSGGADIEKPLDEITLLDLYNAVECVEDENLFH